MERKRRFSRHADVITYAFDRVPLNEELWIMDEKWIDEFDEALVSMEDIFAVGYKASAIAHSRGKSAVELSLILNQVRFHQIPIVLPRSEFVACIDRPSYDIKPRLFVRSAWLTRLHLKRYSAFAMIDAVGFKDALRDGLITQDRLLTLRAAIDKLADKYPKIAFVSFADNLLVKADWTIGQYDSDVPYDYAPENLLWLVADIQELYRAVLKLDVYAVLTQGNNEYDDDSPLYISQTKNHVSLNSLGLPFAQLLAIDAAAKDAIKAKFHSKCELYMDKSFYLSLRLDYKVDRSAPPRYNYRAPMASSAAYICSTVRTLLDQLSPT